MSRGIYDPINKVRIPTCGRESYNVDNELSSSSQNAVENRVITGEFEHVFNINDTSENTLADDDLFPFYDASAPGKKKTAWSNIVAKIKSALSTVAISGSYNDLSNKPNLATVATSGSYNDLSNKPNLATVATSGSYNDLSNKPNLATVATSGSYNDLSNKPNLATVATSGSYNDLSNKPNLATVATSGSYNDLTNKPNLATVATSGSYNDLTNKPELQSWTPQIYDYNTYKRSITQNAYTRYTKIGGIVIASLYWGAADLSGISTMLQIRNLPMTWVIGGSLYFGGLTSQGADYTFQAAEHAYVRPNITSSKFSNPSSAGVMSALIIGLE